MAFEFLPLILSVILGLLVIPHMVLPSTPKKTDFVRQNGILEQTQGIPLCGISLFLIVIITLGISFGIPFLIGGVQNEDEIKSLLVPLFQIFVGGSLLFLAGLKDDLNGTSGFVKFSALFISALLLPFSGFWISDLGGFLGFHQIPSFIGMPLTVIAVMYITFAFSILDGIDGLCRGFGVVLLTTLLLLSCFYGSSLILVLSSSTLGVLIVLSVMHFRGDKSRPAMMGNAGAYVLGYLLASLSVFLFNKEAAVDSSALIYLGVLLFPMLDVLRVLGSRIRDGRKIEMPDRNLINYKLIRTGLRHSLVPVSLVLLMSVFVLFNVIGYLLDIECTILVVGSVALWVLMQYALNWRIHSFEQLHHKEEWNKLYGKDAWNSHIPHEILRHKVETYGTMGLPPHMQTDNPIEFIPDGMTGLGRSTKRLCDLVLSGCCLVIFSPLLLLCYILIKIDDKGPAIYSQERIGRFGRPFRIYKFRSMRVDAEKNGPALSHASGDEDPRLTKVGLFLRRHHLDELPQLWNVFCGDMAFIGYRPERKFFIDQIMNEDPRYAFLYQIRPGVTSYATLYNGYTDTMEKMLRRLELDLYYLRHRSWWFDCKVLFLTFVSIVFGKKF